MPLQKSANESQEYLLWKDYTLLYTYWTYWKGILKRVMRYIFFFNICYLQQTLTAQLCKNTAKIIIYLLKILLLIHHKYQETSTLFFTYFSYTNLKGNIIKAKHHSFFPAIKWGHFFSFVKSVLELCILTLTKSLKLVIGKRKLSQKKISPNFQLLFVHLVFLQKKVTQRTFK